MATTGRQRQQYVPVKCTYVERQLAGAPFWIGFDRGIEQGPLYKYLPAWAALRMLNLGEVRITTLYECRGWENDAARGDRDEGTRARIGILPDGTYTSTSLKQLPEFFDVFEIPEGLAVELKGVIVDRPESVADCYLYCATYSFDPSVMFDDFCCTAAVRIDQPRRFFSLLTLALRDHVRKALTVSRVSYERRGGHYQSVRTEVPPTFVKDPRFSRQCEVRALWTARSLPIEPIVLAIPGLRQCVSPYFMPGIGIVRGAPRPDLSK